MTADIIDPAELVRQSKLIPALQKAALTDGAGVCATCHHDVFTTAGTGQCEHVHRQAQGIEPDAPGERRPEPQEPPEPSEPLPAEGADPGWNATGSHGDEQSRSSSSDSSNSASGSAPEGNPDGAMERAYEWLGRHILTVEEADLQVLTLWALHTWLVEVIPVSPRLILDSILPGSGKTTVLEHFDRLCLNPTNMSDVTSPALLVRTLAEGQTSFLIDEADRSLDPKKELTSSLLQIINSGYKPGAARPVLMPSKEKGWESRKMSTYAAVAMAGNSPMLPPDTYSRSHRVFLVPDINDEVEETDWTEDDFESAARQIGADLAAWALRHKREVKTARPEFPDGVRGRIKERWVAFARIAQVLAGPWPPIVWGLMTADLDRERMEREDGMTNIPPRMQALLDAADILEGKGFMPTLDLVSEMIRRSPDKWGEMSPHGQLTRQALNRMLSKSRVHSQQEKTGARRRGYYEADIKHITDKLKPNRSNGSNHTNHSNDSRKGPES